MIPSISPSASSSTYPSPASLLVLQVASHCNGSLSHPLASDSSDSTTPNPCHKIARLMLSKLSEHHIARICLRHLEIKSVAVNQTYNIPESAWKETLRRIMPEGTTAPGLKNIKLGNVEGSSSERGDDRGDRGDRPNMRNQVARILAHVVKISVVRVQAPMMNIEEEQQHKINKGHIHSQLSKCMFVFNSKTKIVVLWGPYNWLCKVGLQWWIPCAYCSTTTSPATATTVNLRRIVNDNAQAHINSHPETEIERKTDANHRAGPHVQGDDARVGHWPHTDSHLNNSFPRSDHVEDFQRNKELQAILNEMKRQTPSWLLQLGINRLKFVCASYTNQQYHQHQTQRLETNYRDDAIPSNSHHHDKNPPKVQADLWLNVHIKASQIFATNTKSDVIVHLRAWLTYAKALGKLALIVHDAQSLFVSEKTGHHETSQDLQLDPYSGGGLDEEDDELENEQDNEVLAQAGKIIDMISSTLYEDMSLDLPKIEVTCCPYADEDSGSVSFSCTHSESQSQPVYPFQPRTHSPSQTLSQSLPYSSPNAESMASRSLSSPSLIVVLMFSSHDNIPLPLQRVSIMVPNQMPQSSSPLQSSSQGFEKQHIMDLLDAHLGGMYDVKARIASTLSMEYQQKMAFWGIKSSCSFLLYGLPGTGKTLLVKTLAKYFPSDSLIILDSNRLVRSQVNESEKKLQRAFHSAYAKERAIIYIDEIDTLFANRGDASSLRRLVSTLLIQMDQLDFINASGPKVILMASTNCPWVLDSSLVRPGRFSHCIHVPVPDQSERYSIASLAMSKVQSMKPVTAHPTILPHDKVATITTAVSTRAGLPEEEEEETCVGDRPPGATVVLIKNDEDAFVIWTRSAQLRIARVLDKDQEHLTGADIHSLIRNSVRMALDRGSIWRWWNEGKMEREERRQGDGPAKAEKDGEGEENRRWTGEKLLVEEEDVEEAEKRLKGHKGSLALEQMKAWKSRMSA